MLEVISTHVEKLSDDTLICVPQFVPDEFAEIPEVAMATLKVIEMLVVG